MPEKREWERKIRIAYVLGVLHGWIDEGAKEIMEGYLALFAIPEDILAIYIMADEKGAGDVYRVGKVTSSDITTILKAIYGESYNSLRKAGKKMRRKRLDKKQLERSLRSPRL